MLVTDTSAVVALADARDQNHSRVVAALADQSGPLIVPMAILAEIAYMLSCRLGATQARLFLKRFFDEMTELDPGLKDMERALELMERYENLPLGFADACVIVCAERSGCPVLTLDQDFEIVAREGKITAVP